MSKELKIFEIEKRLESEELSPEQKIKLIRKLRRIADHQTGFIWYMLLFCGLLLLAMLLGIFAVRLS